MVSQCLDMDGVIRDVEAAFRGHGFGTVGMPAKISLDMRPFGLSGWMNAMPAYVGDSSMYGIKWAGGFIDNPRLHQLSYVMATIVLNDPQNGLPLAVMDGIVITNMRTGAAAAVAAKYLAKRGSGQVAIIGAGAQGRTSLLALSKLHKLTEVRVTDVRQNASERFKIEMEERVGVSIKVTSTAREAADGADIIVTATTANTPLFPESVAKPGSFIASMGSFPELDPSLVLDANKIVVDSLEQCLHRGELVKLIAEGRLQSSRIHAELGDVVIGKKTGREDPSERIVACLIGMASEDIAVAASVYRKAIELGIGERFSFT
jgi:alanine dehydrogenase